MLPLRSIGRKTHHRDSIATGPLARDRAARQGRQPRRKTVKIPRIHRDQSLDMNTAMTPMIDVVFLLLIFFVWTLSFQAIERLLPSQLSQEVGKLPADLQQLDPRLDFERIVIRLTGAAQQPTYQVNQQVLASLEEVRGFLQLVAAVNQQSPVVIHPDDTIPLGHVIGLLDITRQSGFSQVSFATQDPRD